MHPSTKPIYTEAIIVLANLMDMDGTLNEESVSRLECAAKLIYEHPNACLVTTGWNYRADTPIYIANAFKESAIKDFGIDGHRIIADINARDTVGDAVFVKMNVLEPLNITRAIIVSSQYHIARVQEIFSFVLGPDFQVTCVGAPSPLSEHLKVTENQSLGAFYKTFSGISAGATQQIYARMREQHPFYNGEIHPRIDPLTTNP
jgi:hypothetical protein